MTDRLKKLIELIPNSDTLADIGCDHGYVSLGALESGKVKKVIFSDVSALCLKKAESLLSSYIECGMAEGIVSDGFKCLPQVSTAVIAGMGGEETVKIISSCSSLPKTLILQPMKNVDKVRECALKYGYKVEFDRVYFFEKKYYDFIVLEKGEDFLTEEEIMFGRTNIVTKNVDFLNRLKEQKKLLEKVLLNNLSREERFEKEEQLKKIKKYV